MFPGRRSRSAGHMLNWGKWKGFKMCTMEEYAELIEAYCMLRGSQKRGPCACWSPSVQRNVCMHIPKATVVFFVFTKEWTS